MRKIEGYIALVLAVTGERLQDKEIISLSEIDCDVIDRLLAALPDRTRGIISLRFGLEKYDIKKPEITIPTYASLKAIGEIFSIGLERVRQIQNHALRLMRKPERIKFFWFIRKIAAEKGAKVTDEKGEKLIEKAASVLVDDLEISIRAKTALKNGGIRNLRDALKMGRRELLRIKGFGNHSLRKLVEAASEIDISLAWKL